MTHAIKPSTSSYTVTIKGEIRVSFAPGTKGLSPAKPAAPAHAPIPTQVKIRQPILRCVDPLKDVLRWLKGGSCLVFHRHGTLEHVLSNARTPQEQTLLGSEVNKRRVILIDTADENVLPLEKLFFRAVKDQGFTTLCVNKKALEKIAGLNLPHIYKFAAVDGKLISLLKKPLEAPRTSGDIPLDVLMWVRNGDCIVARSKERTFFWHRCPAAGASPPSAKEQLKKTRVIFIDVQQDAVLDKLPYGANLVYRNVKCQCNGLQKEISSGAPLPHAYSLQLNNQLLDPAKL